MVCFKLLISVIFCFVFGGGQCLPHPSHDMLFKIFRNMTEFSFGNFILLVEYDFDTLIFFYSLLHIQNILAMFCYSKNNEDNKTKKLFWMFRFKKSWV